MNTALTLRPRRVLLVAFVALVIGALALALAPSSHHGHDTTASAASRASRTTFHDAMRQLWEDHIVWTRMVIVSVADDLPDLPTAVDRLLRNQDDIGDAIKPFYGDAAGEELSRLLREHITGAADLLAAAKAGDGDAVAEARAAWYVNGDAIAAFLAKPIRNWELAEMQAMMRTTSTSRCRRPWRGSKADTRTTPPPTTRSMSRSSTWPTC